MGWDFAKGATKADVVAEVAAGWTGTRCLRHTVKGRVVWAVMETTHPDRVERWIRCTLLDTARIHGELCWGRKDMDETMGPFYYDCPLEYLALAPETNPAWRAKVLAHHGVAAVPPVTAELFA